MLLSRALRRLRRLVTRSPQEEREHHLHPYRGYGSREEIYLVGRVFRQKPTRVAGAGSLLVEIGRRLFRRGVADAVVDARFHGGTRRVTTDRALHRGTSGAELNPILYVSRGPWGIYEMLDAFFKHHDIYVDLVREHPGRVLAVYIRNVSRKPARKKEIEVLADELIHEGSSLLLASDTFAMAAHAAEHGFISPEALAEVLTERIEEEGKADVHPVEKVARSTRHATQRAVEEGKLEEALKKDTGEKSPPNVVVEQEVPRISRKSGS